VSGENLKSAIHTPAIGVGVLVWKDKQLLLGKRLHKDQSISWQFPGGHLECNESVTECARREVFEETGLQIKQLRHLGFTNKSFEVNHQQYIALFVSAEYESGEVKVLEPEKCDSWRWFDFSNFPSPLFLPVTLFLEQHGIVKSGSTSGISCRNKSYLTLCADLYALHCAAEIMPSSDD